MLMTQTLPNERLVSVANDANLMRELVAIWLSQTLEKGGGAVAICTSDSWLTISNRLRQNGFNPQRLREEGRLRVIDAERFVADFLADGAPDPEVFHHQIGQPQKPVRANCSIAEVRVWNEAIDLLHELDEPWAAEFLESLRLETTDRDTIHLVSPEEENPRSSFDALEQETEWVPYSCQEPVQVSAMPGKSPHKRSNGQNDPSTMN